WFGRASPEPEDSMPVAIQLPDRISTAGLIGVTLSTEGDLHPLRGHRWGSHDVRSATEATWRSDPAAICVQITSSEVGARTAPMEFGARLFRNRGKDSFHGACEVVGADSAATEVIRGPRGGGTPGEYDLELVVNRVPHMSPAHAYRRGVQWVLAALDA